MFPISSGGCKGWRYIKMPTTLYVGENKIYTREELTNYINNPANGWVEQE